MPTRLLLIGLLLLLLARAIWRLLVGIVAGASLPGPSGTPQRGEHMERDPVCGTFVLPSRAVRATRDGQVRYFCSERCLDTYDRRAS